EISVVRAVRPDLDSGVEALAERVGVLERTVSGGAAFPRPAPAASRKQTQSPADDAPSPSASPPPEAESAPERVADAGAGIGGRPSIGAVRRRQQADAKATEADEADAPAPEPEPEPEVAPTAPAPAPSGPAVATRSLDRDTLTEAWGDAILQSLPARAKARFASGRFVAVDELGAHFALPHAAHRDQCAEQLPIVEQALERHFGTKVKLVLEVDDEAAPPPARGGGPAARRDTATRARGAARDDPPDDDVVDDLHDIDPSDLADDGGNGEDEASAAQARLMQAFPGASEVVG
ncbi:MAG TPA: hypothetical protein VIX84_00420, partial [Acidimicrobiales bacterium]